MARNPNNFMLDLQKFFNIKVIKDPQDKNKNVVVPTVQTNPNLNTFSPAKYPDNIKKFWDYWGKECYDTGRTLSDRFNRYDDLDYLYYNFTIISRAIDMYGDEATQDDSQFNIIHCESEDSTFPDYFYDLLNKWGLGHEQLNNICRNLAQYGDAFTINVVDENEGVKTVTPVDVKTIKDRVEFSSDKVEARMLYQKSLNNSTPVSNYTHLQRLAQVVSDKENISAFYQTYLFGYKLSDTQYLPPWNICHFRLYDTKSEFYPFGRPLLINCIAPARQLKASETIYEIGRAMNIPKEYYEVETAGTMTEIDKWKAVNSAREEFENLNYNLSNKEDYGVGGKVWTPKGLLSYESKSPNIPLDDIAGLEYYTQRIATGTGIPASILLTDDKGWGTSGISLMQQYKPFARSVKKVQSPVLREITQLVRIHLIITGDYDPNIDFTLSMNFPALEETNERLTQKSNSLALAGNIITTLKQSLGIGSDEDLPVDVVKQILSRNTFIKAEDLDDWIKKYSKEHAAKEKELQKQKDKELNNNISDEDSEEEVIDNPKDKKKKKDVQERQKIIRSRLTEKVVNEAYYKSFKKLNLKEGVFNRRHFVNSTCMDPQQRYILETLKESKKEERLREYQEIKDGKRTLTI